MKKNFLMVASLLIAAMLMVVSCTQEVAPVDNNLVEVTLNTSAARSALEYDGLKIENVNYRYKLTAQWTPTGDQDPVVGNTAGAAGADDDGYISFTGTSKGLGYVSQGLWQVDVTGSITSKDGTSKDVLKGSTQVYFNKNNEQNSVTVYVKPIDDDTTNAGLSFDIKINDHDVLGAYKLVYSIQNVDGVTAKGIVDDTKTTAEDLTNKDLTKGNLDATSGYRTWTGKVTGMKPGYYRVTVSLLNGIEVVGGLTKGVLLFAGDADNAKLTGSVNSMDFVNGQLNVVYPKVSLTLASGLNENKGTINSEVTYTATPTFEAALPSGYTVDSPTFTWYENGGSGTGKAATAENNTATFKQKYSTPGYKTVTCVVKYTLNVPNGNNTGKTETVAFSVQADAALTVLIN